MVHVHRVVRCVDRRCLQHVVPDHLEKRVVHPQLHLVLKRVRRQPRLLPYVRDRRTVDAIEWQVERRGPFDLPPAEPVELFRCHVALDDDACAVLGVGLAVRERRQLHLHDVLRRQDRMQGPGCDQATSMVLGHGDVGLLRLVHARLVVIDLPSLRGRADRPTERTGSRRNRVLAVPLLEVGTDDVQIVRSVEGELLERNVTDRLHRQRGERDRLRMDVLDQAGAAHRVLDVAAQAVALTAAHSVLVRIERHDVIAVERARGCALLVIALVLDQAIEREADIQRRHQPAPYAM